MSPKKRSNPDLLYQEWREGKRSLEQLKEELRIQLYNYPRQTRYQEEICAEFYLYCESRIESLIERYIPAGYSFKSYFHQYLNYRYRTLQNNHHRHYQHQLMLYQVNSMELKENNPDFCPAQKNIDTDKLPRCFKPDKEGKIPTGAMRQRFLFLCLKHPFLLKTTDLPHIARLTGIPLQVLDHTVQNLRCCMNHRYARREKLIEKRNNCFCQIRSKELRREFLEDPAEIEKSASQLKILRKRLDKLNTAINKISLTATHRDIALLMRVPKGTVDSSLFMLRKALSDISE